MGIAAYPPYLSKELPPKLVKRRPSTHSVRSTSGKAAGSSLPFAKVAEIRKRIADLGIDSDHTRTFFGDAYLKMDHPFQFASASSGVKTYADSPWASSDLGGTLIDIVDGLGRSLTQSVPHVPITLLKPIDAVEVAFAVDIRHPSEERRLETMSQCMDLVRQSIAVEPNLTMEPGAALHRKGDFHRSDLDVREYALTQVQFSIQAPIQNPDTASSIVKTIRNIIRQASFPDTVSKVHYGSAHAIVLNPDRHRSELLEAIFNDLADLDARLGEDFSVQAKVGNASVRLRQASPGEIEFWIPYDFEVISLQDREQEELRREREHEQALARIKAEAYKCCQNAPCRSHGSD